MLAATASGQLLYECIKRWPPHLVCPAGYHLGLKPTAAIAIKPWTQIGML